MRQHLSCFALLVALCGPGFAQTATKVPPAVSAPATVPRLIRFAGQVKGTGGTVGITFTLHKQQQDNVALWTETQNVKLDNQGRYSILLGAAHADGIPAELFTSGEAQWLAIRAEGQPEQRVLLVSVPYAVKAAEAETLAGHTATEFVTTDKLTSVVEQQVRQKSGAVVPARKSPDGAVTNVVTNAATNFTDTTTNQVVLITQNGTGSGLIANAVNTYAIQAKSTNGGAIYASGAGNAALNAFNTATSGTAYALIGSTASTSGVGFRGAATATSGTTYGVMGDSASPSGTGMYGTNSSTTAGGVGVYGRASGPSGIGVRAVAASISGNTTGLLATVLSGGGTAAVLQNGAAGKLLSGQVGAGNTEVFAVDGAGFITGHDISVVSKVMGDTVTATSSVTAPQFVSTVGTGTPPFSVTSQTMVPNLNAQYLNGVASNQLVLLGGSNTFGSVQYFTNGLQASSMVRATNSTGSGAWFTGAAGFSGVRGDGGGYDGSASGPGGQFFGGAGDKGGMGLFGTGGAGNTQYGGAGGVFLGGNSTSAQGGAGAQMTGGTSNSAAGGDGLIAQGGGAFTAGASTGRGVQGLGGNSTLSPGAGGTGGDFYGGWNNAASGTNYGGTGVRATGGNVGTGFGGDGLYATGGTGTTNGFAARLNGDVSFGIPTGTVQMVAGDAGCGTGFYGLGFGTIPVNLPGYRMSSCSNYNLLGNGNDLLLNVPSGGTMYFRQNNGTNMSITSSGNVSIAHNAVIGGTTLLTGNTTEFGSMSITHDLTVSGTLSAGTKNFVIDDPLDPQNKLLYHTSIESPDMKDLYDGVIVLNAKGEAWVTLPRYFEALNQDFRYTLTAIGRGAPYLHVAREIQGNRFKIAGGRANQKVSWQVTGIRHDAFAKANPARTEVEKTVAQRGKYLHPEAFGQPAENAMEMNPRDSGATKLAQANVGQN